LKKKEEKKKDVVTAGIPVSGCHRFINNIKPGNNILPSVPKQLHSFFLNPTPERNISQPIRK
jgi:hypothetical protein